MTTTCTDRTELFANLADPDTAARFFDRVADDVDWTVQGTHPLAGRYRSKQAFFDATFARLGRVMRDGVRLEVDHVHLTGDVAIAELRATSTTVEGAPFANRYCWVCRFESDAADAKIVEVRAYLDSAMVTWTIDRNEAVLVATE